jgi:hypothetical protein
MCVGDLMDDIWIETGKTEDRNRVISQVKKFSQRIVSSLRQ